ncbi:hypothetical protein SAMN05661096_01485 [Marivirga sericea]|uniref:CarboxypepD_reg-like domain-containing protein n=1 Tax=Marivirga sericea TaxID=1028 RepID=A0A1X7JAA2_9BACT|nr:hypothetical protein [Marivirga sericea]SMG24750.1 hypothetical protein SAMN05661096_01485 [Marivirga sericea]
MKPISTILILSFSFIAQYAFSQNKEFVLWDKEDSQPIESALILNQTQSKESAISNSNGLFEIPQSWQKNDSLFVHHVNYETTAFTISKDLKDTVYIKPQDFVLDEVVVYAETTLEQFLKDIVVNTERKLKLPVKYDAYYKEFTLENDKYISFADGSMQFYLEEKRGDLNIEASLLESRAVNLETSEEIDLSLVAPIGFESALSYTDPSRVSRFLNVNNFDNYNYSIKDGESFITILASPKKPESDTYSNGKILVNKGDSTISYLQFQLHPISIENMKVVNAVIMKSKIKDYRVTVKYSAIEDNLMLDYVRMNVEMRLFNDKKIDQTNTFINDLSILKPSENQESISWGDQYRKKSIAKNGTNYQTEFWKNASHVSLSAEELELINSDSIDFEAN